MLQKSLSANADLLIYDLEDSVSASAKPHARKALTEFLASEADALKGKNVAVRPQAVGAEGWEDDLKAVLPHSNVNTIVLPKVHSPSELNIFAGVVHTARGIDRRLDVVASIESARGMWSVGDIASWRSRGGVKLSALLFAAEDYCADGGIVRTPSRRELLYPRARLATAAKAYGLMAIDMVCVDYKDEQVARDEATEAREMGYDGKQAIHPSQLSIYNKTFLPSSAEVRRASLILTGMEKANSEQGAGAFGLEVNGRTEMIDMPMLRQAWRVLARARQAGMDIPDYSTETTGK